ncbi:MAG: hypothetical protein ABIP36_01145 [Acidimicrobiales bacterium]
MGRLETTRLEPGCHVRAAVDPLAQATEMAADLDADLCVSDADVQGILAELATLPALDVESIERLRGLADRVAAAQRIADRTLDRAATEVGERMAEGGAGLAVHPSAVRGRAGAVVDARAAVSAADAALRAREAVAAPAPHPGASPAPWAPSALTSTEDEPPARRRWFASFGRRLRSDDPEDTRESSIRLQQVAASTDEAFGARRATAPRDDQLVLLGVQRDRALEDLRVVERAWRDLAGDAVVEDVEAVVRRFDPQHQDALAVAGETAGVRAVSSLLQRSMERWADGWRSLGLDPPAAFDQEGFERLCRRLTRPVVLVGEAVDQAECLATAAPAAAVVAVEPVAT